MPKERAMAGGGEFGQAAAADADGTHSPPLPQECVMETEQEAGRIARQMFHQNPDWVTFFREILGADGVVRRLFPTSESLIQFERTETYEEIERMLAELRSRGPAAVKVDEPIKVITVRLPKTMHDALRAEAHLHHTSMNKLCISKLLRLIDNEMIAADGQQGRVVPDKQEEEVDQPGEESGGGVDL
jgi:predicted HicB family RNase H-like nuclease